MSASSHKLHIEPMEREEVEWLLGALGIAEGIASKLNRIPSGRAEALKGKLRAALDSQPEQGDRKVRCILCECDVPKSEAQYIDSAEPPESTDQMYYSCAPGYGCRQPQKGGEGWPEEMWAALWEGRVYPFTDKPTTAYPVRRYVPAPASPEAEQERERADRLEIENRELEDANRSLAKMRDKALEGNLAVSEESSASPKAEGEEKGKREAVERKLEHTEQWYAVRIERLRDLTRERSKAAEPGSEMAQVWADIASILANGTLGPPDHPYEPPTYAQQLNIQRHRAKAAKSSLERLAGELEERAERHEAEGEAPGGCEGDTAAKKEALFAAQRLREEAEGLSTKPDELPAIWKDQASFVLRSAEDAAVLREEAEGLPGPDAISSHQAGQGEAERLGAATKDRCPTCGSSNPWFTDCKDKAQAKAETGRDFPSHPSGCNDPWHAATLPPESQEDWNDERKRALEGLPAELAAALQEPGVFVPQDSSVFRLIQEWADAPSNTASAPPASESQEGQHD